MSIIETEWVPLTEAVLRFHGAGIQLTYNQLYRRVLDAKIPSTRLGGQIAINYRKAPITDRQKLMLDFAIKVAGPDSHTITDADIKPLKDAGFTDEDVWDINAITAFYGLSNRMANVTGMMPNDEFHSMGRG